MNTKAMNTEHDERMMRRALQLARRGYGFTSPNPMVGAVITDATGRIIGEGWHRRWGGPHAEVNAVASVADKSLLPQSTIYVTLEPCSHYGKTPPCARLLIESGLRRVVIGCLDPFEQVSGRGVAMLRQAGIEVVTGVLQPECEALNVKFMYAHRHARPYVLLKWAQSADGFMAGAEGRPLQLSNPVSRVFMHRLRAGYDAIMVGTGTILTDNPQLTCRLWPSRRLRPVVLDARGHVPTDCALLANPDTILLRRNTELPELLNLLYKEYSVTSLMVEGGPRLLQSFLDSKLAQAVRIEVSPLLAGEGIAAPRTDLLPLPQVSQCGSNPVYQYNLMACNHS